MAGYSKQQRVVSFKLRVWNQKKLKDLDLMQTWYDPIFNHFNLNLTNIGGVAHYKN